MIAPFALANDPSGFIDPLQVAENPAADTLPVVQSGGRSFRYIELSTLTGDDAYPWATEGNTEPVPDNKISAAVRGHRLFIQTSPPAGGVQGDVWIRDAANLPLAIFERGLTTWELDYTIHGGRVHHVDFLLDVNADNPLANPRDIALQFVAGVLTLYSRLPTSSAPFWSLVGVITGGEGGGEPGDDAYDWATEGFDDLLVPTDKVNLSGVQLQIDEIVNEIAHSQGALTAVVPTIGGGMDSLRYVLPPNLNGLYDISVRVKSRVQINEFANISGNLQIIEDGGNGLNLAIPQKVHHYQHSHEGTLNFIRKGLSISPGVNQLDFITNVTGQNPPDVHFVEVENLSLTNTSLVNSSNVRPFILDWAEEGNTDPVPDPKLSGVKQWALESSPPLDVPTAEDIGTFDNADIAAIANQDEQLFVLEALVQRDADGTLATITRGWEPSADAGVAGPQPLGTANLTITTAATFHATGVTLTSAHTWAYISMDTHEEDVGGLVGHYAPGPWLRILVSDLLGLVDVTTATTPSSSNSIHSEVEIQNFREVDIGTTASGEMLVSIPHKNANSTITGPLRVRVN